MAKFTWLVDEKTLNTIVVNKPPIGRETYKVAKKIGAVAKATLAAHRDKGHSEIEVVRGSKRVDAFVNLKDDRGAKAAAAIEFGFTNESGYHPGPAPLRTGIASVK